MTTKGNTVTTTSRRARPPLAPELRPLVRAQLSRRGALRGAGLAGLGALLAACGTSGAPATGDATSSSGEGGGSGDRVVNWAHWTLYLDYDEETQSYPTLDAFMESSGITVNYSEDIDGNDTYWGRIQGQLANGQDIGQDIIVFTDWMAARCISLGYAQEIDAAAVPNKANILPSLAQVDFDPGRTRSLTWQSGIAGVAWNKERVPEGLRTVSDLWRPELKGRVEVLDEMRDTIGLIMAEQGVDIAGTWGSSEFTSAIEVLEQQISSGQIRQVRGNSYKEDLISGDALAVIGWSGDLTQINFENDDQWEFAIPEAGGTLWSDNMLIPVGSPHKSDAEKVMDYYYDPEVAAQVAAYVNYICPVQGAQEAMEAIDPELAGNTSIFPDEATLAKLKVFRTLSADEESEFNEQFQTAIGN